MPIMWMLVAIIIATSALFSIEQTRQNREIRDAEILALSGSMLVYRNIVAKFSEANPAFVGSASDSALNLPAWYVRPLGLNNYIVAGKSYIFFTDAVPGLAGSLARDTESINVGTNIGGVLISPNTGNTGILLPAQIPVSAVAMIL
jgi:hypothetical protein